MRRHAAADALRRITGSLSFHSFEGSSSVAMKQSASIPYRIDQGRLRVLLVTSRTRRRWILPKGKVAPRMLPGRSAEREAFEEAGVLGRLAKDPIGS